jgi:hypothetical protein
MGVGVGRLSVKVGQGVHGAEASIEVSARAGRP